MGFFGDVEVGLLEDEGHAEEALVEVDGGFAVGADDGDVVDALGLDGGAVHSSSRTWCLVDGGPPGVRGVRGAGAVGGSMTDLSAECGVE